MSAEDEPLTAVDGIRWVYLARMARRQGNQPAARRWQAKADRRLAWQTERRSPSLTLSGHWKSLHGVAGFGSCRPFRQRREGLFPCETGGLRRIRNMEKARFP